jgi:hypothetical protein
VRIITACGAPGTASPSGPVSLVMTFAGVSSPHRTSSACSAAFIAVSNPAACSRCASRASARAANPLDTGVPGRASISAAARSTGTLPSEDSSTPAALMPGPHTTDPACTCGATAVVISWQHPHRRRGSRQRTFSITTGRMSRACARAAPASPAPQAGSARPAPHPRHCAATAAVSARSGTAAGASPDPLIPLLASRLTVR